MAPLQDQALSSGWEEPRATALLVLANGMVFEGVGIGATGEATGEVCFNTAMTGYQEILTDPSYAGQIITFGRASGPIPPIDVATMLNRDALTVSAGTLFAFTEGLGRLQLMGREWFEALLAGKVKISVNQTYAMKDAAQAHRDLEARKTTGSTVLLPQ